MIKNHLTRKAAALFLAATILPVSAMAVTEDTVIDVPDIELDSIDTDIITTSYLPDASYYADYGDYQPSWYDSDEYVELPNDGNEFTTGALMQDPWLTAGEQRRAAHLQELYESGEIKYSGESVLNKLSDVIVGVYPLNPEDYDGETMFVVLPVCCLSDDMLLAVIDAFHQAGQIFDPAALNYRNCMRGGGLEVSRVFTSDEQERSNNIHLLIMRGMLKEENVHAESAIRNVGLSQMYFNGMETFRLQPYRMITDDELARWWYDSGAHAFDEDSLQPDDIEQIGREMAYSMINVPFSMTEDCQDEQNMVAYYEYKHTTYYGMMVQPASQGYEAAAYVISFSWSEGEKSGHLTSSFFQNDQGEIVPILLIYTNDVALKSGWSDSAFSKKTADDWVDAASTWSKENLFIDGANDLQWTVMTDDVISDEGTCAYVTALTDDYIIQLKIYHNSLEIAEAGIYKRAE